MKPLKMEFSSSMDGWGERSSNDEPIRLEESMSDVGGNFNRGAHRLPSLRFVPVMMGKSRKSPSRAFLAGYSSMKEP
jgi:hypothetical protein